MGAIKSKIFADSMVFDIEQEQQQQQQQQQTPTSTLKKPTKTNDYFIYNHQLIMDEARKKLIIEQETKNIILIDACLSEKASIKQENTTQTQNLNKTKTNSTRSSMSNLAESELKYNQLQEQKLKTRASFDPVARLETGAAQTVLDKAKNENTNKSQNDTENHDTPNEAADANNIASFQPSNNLQKSQYFRSFRSASRRFFGLNQNSNASGNKKQSSNENESNKMGKHLNSSYLNRSFKNLSNLKKLVGSNSTQTDQLSSRPAEKKDSLFRNFVSKSQTDLNRKFSDDQDFPSSRSRHKVFNRNIINRSMINPRREGFLTSNSSWLYLHFKSKLSFYFILFNLIQTSSSEQKTRRHAK